MQARGRWALRDRPGVMWLALAILVALGHRAFADSRWVMVHLVMLGAITHSIVVWSAHFSTTWLKIDHRQLSRDVQSKRLILLNVGAALVVLSVPVPFTPAWWVTVLGATLVAVAVAWHAYALTIALRKALNNRWRAAVGHYVLAACFLLGGIVLGVLLARRPADEWHGRLLVAHTVLNVLGWVGASVLGTLATLWPTMLRTKMPDAALRNTRRTLAAIALGVTLVATGALVDTVAVSLVGLATFVVGLILTWTSMVRAARTGHVDGFAPWSVLAGQVWLATSVVTLAATLATQPSWVHTGQAYGRQTTMFVVGFALQTLLGALTFLVPVVLGGGPKILKAAGPILQTWAAARLVLVNAGLAICVLTDVTWVRAAVSVLVLFGLGLFVPLMLRAIKAAVKARLAMVAAAKAGIPAGDGMTARRVEGLAIGSTPAAMPAPASPLRREDTTPRRPSPALQALSAVVALLVAVAAGVAIDPVAAGFGGSTSAAVTSTGHTTTVDVSAANMRFTPATITVPTGDKLVIRLKNTDAEQTHDLVLANGATSGRLAPGESRTFDAGVIGGNLDGWCSIVGHKQMGMTLAVRTSGSASASMPMNHSGMGSTNSTSPQIDAMKPWSSSFTARDARLPALTSERHHRMTLTVTEKEIEVAPGVQQKRWTYNGDSIGPTLHGRVGDTFDITLVNDGSMGHSIDFHAGSLSPGKPMRTIAPGQRLTYRFTATKAGAWLYHCSTMPMSTHIAAGMAGAVVIEPDGLEPVPSYVLVQSELYLGGQGEPVNADKVATQVPDAVVFNGYVRQYDDRPLRVRKGERTRIWVVDAGPNRASIFHIVGGQFDTTYLEGAYQLKRGKDAFGTSNGGAQALAVQPAQGGFVEFTLPESGRYPFVSHVMSDAEKGARGIIEVK